MTELSNGLFEAIMDLPKKEAQILLAALESGKQLNRKLRKLLEAAEDAADRTSAIRELVELEARLAD